MPSRMDTRLIRAVVFLCPLHPHCLLNVCPQFVTVPWHVWYLRAFAYLLPSFVMDPLSLIMGACNGMTTFKGRGVEWSMGKVQ